MPRAAGCQQRPAGSGVLPAVLTSRLANSALPLSCTEVAVCAQAARLIQENQMLRSHLHTFLQQQQLQATPSAATATPPQPQPQPLGQTVGHQHQLQILPTQAVQLPNGLCPKLPLPPAPARVAPAPRPPKKTSPPTANGDVGSSGRKRPRPSTAAAVVTAAAMTLLAVVGRSSPQSPGVGASSALALLRDGSGRALMSLDSSTASVLPPWSEERGPAPPLPSQAPPLPPLPISSPLLLSAPLSPPPPVPVTPKPSPTLQLASAMPLAPSAEQPALVVAMAPLPFSEVASPPLGQLGVPASSTTQLALKQRPKTVSWTRTVEQMTQQKLPASEAGSPGFPDTAQRSLWRLAAGPRDTRFPRLPAASYSAGDFIQAALGGTNSQGSWSPALTPITCTEALRFEADDGESASVAERKAGSRTVVRAGPSLRRLGALALQPGETTKGETGRAQQQPPQSDDPAVVSLVLAPEALAGGHARILVVVLYRGTQYVTYECDVPLEGAEPSSSVLSPDLPPTIIAAGPVGGGGVQ